MRCCAHACEPITRVMIWLPQGMIAKARRLSPTRMRSHLGCILAEALRDYIVKRKREAFARGVRRMAQNQEFLKAMAAPSPIAKTRRRARNRSRRIQTR
jgi:hypothetical protein